jgi:hypothetical protein
MTYIARPTKATDTTNVVRFINDELAKVARETVGQTQGTWTPGLAVGSGSVTISSASGEFVQIGNLMHISGTIQLSASTATGTIDITGLPIAQVIGRGVIPFRYENLSGVSAGVMGYVDDRTIRVQAMTATGADNPTLTNSTLLEFSGSYLV